MSESMAKDIFKQFGTEHNFDGKIVDRIATLGFENLQEFALIPKGKLESLFVAPASLGEQAPVNLARLNIAQDRVSGALKTVEETDLEKSKKENDIDGMLLEKEHDSQGEVPRAPQVGPRT